LCATKVLWVFEHEEEVDMTNKYTEQLIPTSAHTHTHTDRQKDI